MFIKDTCGGEIAEGKNYAYSLTDEKTFTSNG